MVIDDKIGIFQKRYENRLNFVLKNTNINSKNRKIMKEFLRYYGYKLKRRNGLADIDERSYKTLYFYIGRLEKINDWFKNKTWVNLTEKDIIAVIDKLEDGSIRTKRNKRYSDRGLYYLMFTGKLFELVGKSDLAKNHLKEFAIVGRVDKNLVKFITEEKFREITDCVPSQLHKLLLWLAWDIGENITSLLELEKHEFERQINEDTNEPEYIVRLNGEKLKRSRTARPVVTNYIETVRLLDKLLPEVKRSEKIVNNKYGMQKVSDLHGDDKLFKFQWSTANKFLSRAVKKSGIKCVNGDNVTWKDLRSSMACDLIKKGWTTDEVKARLGHRPSSRMIDKYVTYLTMDNNKPKKKIFDSNVKKLEVDVKKLKESNKLILERYSKIIKLVELMGIQYTQRELDMTEEEAGYISVNI